MGGHPQGDPVIPLVWLANHLSKLGRGLRAGQIGHLGDASQLTKARAILADARRALYAVLAEDGNDE